MRGLLPDEVRWRNDPYGVFHRFQLSLAKAGRTSFEGQIRERRNLLAPYIDNRALDLALELCYTEFSAAFNVLNAVALGYWLSGHKGYSRGSRG